MQVESGDWIRIERQLSIKEIDILFAIPYSSHVSARYLYEKKGKSKAFYRYMDYFVYTGLLDKSSKINKDGKRISIYKRTFRFYRVRSDGNGTYIVEVS